MRAALTWPKVRLDKSRDDYVIDCGLVNGKRKVYRRKTVGGAVIKADELRKERERVGELAFSLTPEQRVEAAQCYEAMKKDGCEIPLIDIVQAFIIEQGKEEKDPVTLYEAIDFRVMNMQERCLRPRSVDSTASRLHIFEGTTGASAAYIQNITAEDIQEFLVHFAPPTRVAYIRELKAFFNFCMKRGYCAANPLDGIEPPRIDRGIPEYMSVDDVSRFMQELYNGRYNRYYRHAALGFFAGLRPEELRRLRWDDVNMTEGIITIGAEIAKTRQIRHVTISKNLKEWLWFQPCTNPLTYHNFDHVRRTICKKLDLKWPHDCMRHTFSTFHLSMHRDAALTAHELGHTQGVDLLYTHYRGLATKEEAKTFWNILPFYAEGSE